MNPGYHKLLAKQIERHRATSGPVPDRLEDLFREISSTYELFERDKLLSEHAFSVGEQEYQEVLKNLHIQNDIRKESILKLKEAIISLDPEASFRFERDDDELIRVIGYLEQQLKKTKELELELIQARNDAIQAARAKSEFLSVMSHEIRTPLNAITGLIHIMAEENEQPVHADHLHSLRVSADHLLSLINDILDFSKMEEGKIVFAAKQLCVGEIISNIQSAYQVRAEERGNRLLIQLDAGIPIWLNGDELRLGQVLNNLVSNAVKFTKNGIIRLSVKLLASDDASAELEFSVSDTGIGIAGEKQALIFERFTQANSDITRDYGGSGLGLAIIRRLLHLQGSEIRLESEEGKGARFYFCLRFQKVSGTPENIIPRRKDERNLSGIRVLLVEDVEFNIMVAEKMLQNWKATVDIAENGLKAVGKAKEGGYDIILMDLQMPVLDGYSATRHIRDFDQQTPIIALTASSSSDIQYKTRDYGMTDYVSKPFKPDDLFNTIWRHTRSNSQLVSEL